MDEPPPVDQLAEREAQLLRLNEELDRRKAALVQSAETTLLEQQRRLHDLDFDDEPAGGAFESPERAPDGGEAREGAGARRSSAAGRENEASLGAASATPGGGAGAPAHTPSAIPARRKGAARAAPAQPASPRAAPEAAPPRAAELPDATGMGPEAASRYYRARVHVLSEELERLRALLERTVRARRARAPRAPRRAPSARAHTPC